MWPDMRYPFCIFLLNIVPVTSYMSYKNTSYNCDLILENQS